MTYFEQLKKNIRIILFEQLVYQAILIGYFWYVSIALGLTAYGTLSIVCAYVYAVAGLLNVGFDPTITAVYTQLAQSKSTFARMLWQQFLIQLCGIALITFFIVLQQPAWSKPYLPYALMLACITYSEGIRKTARTILQIANHMRYAALVEVISIATLTLITYGVHAVYDLSVTIALVLLLLYSFVSAMILCVSVYSIYCTMPDDTPKHVSTKRLVLNRISNWINQIVFQFYSSNIALPVFASLYGTRNAGMLALISQSITFVFSLTRKAFSIASATTWAHTRDIPDEEKLILFTQSTSTLYQILTFSSFVCIQIVAALLFYEKSDAYIPLLLLVGAQCIEQYILPYEKFLIAQEHTIALNIYNLFSFTCATLALAAHLSIHTTIALILTTRSICFFILAFIAHRIWRIAPSPTSMRLILLYTSISLALIYALTYVK